MGNSEWDQHLRDMLGDFKPTNDQPHWEEFARELEARDTPLSESEQLQDQQLHDALSHFEPEGKILGWERIEASLNAADKAFDETVRKKVHQYGPPYDPHSWPVFLRKFTDRKLLRAKLIVMKVVEFAAILLLLITVVNMGRLGKLPFETPLFDHPDQVAPASPAPGDRADASVPRDLYPDHPQSDDRSSSFDRRSDLAKEVEHLSPMAEEVRDLGANLDLKSPIGDLGANLELKSPLGDLGANLELKSPIRDLGANTPSAVPNLQLVVNEATYTTDYLALATPEYIAPSPMPVPAVEYVPSKPKTFIEFSILTQADYNKLRMPEDRLYSAGKQIVFPVQGIPSHGFGAGFTIAIGHPAWALETGIVYSGKNFRPGRQLIVGGAFDNGSVEFEAMRLQLVSVPLQYRYRFERQGRLKAYALAGVGAHVIAQSDIDVLIKYHFPSLAAGANPNNDPYFAETIRETRRIREHIRDGAPFSTKSFFSVNAGLGLEYSLTPHKTLFLQTAVQYQIPNLKFSNNNGKHIRTVSLQTGVRTPLGS